MTVLGFYKNDDNTLLYAPTFVAAPTYTLDINLKDTYSYPIDGWLLCNNEVEAKYKLQIIEVDEVQMDQEKITVEDILKQLDSLKDGNDSAVKKLSSVQKQIVKCLGLIS